MFVVMFKGKYLKSGSGHHDVWTRDYAKAAHFETEEEARRNACSNESVIRM